MPWLRVQKCCMAKTSANARQCWNAQGAQRHKTPCSLWVAFSSDSQRRKTRVKSESKASTIPQHVLRPIALEGLYMYKCSMASIALHGKAYVSQADLAITILKNYKVDAQWANRASGGPTCMTGLT